jgi:hypothetical protein
MMRVAIVIVVEVAYWRCVSIYRRVRQDTGRVAPRFSGRSPTVLRQPVKLARQIMQRKSPRNSSNPTFRAKQHELQDDLDTGDAEGLAVCSVLGLWQLVVTGAESLCAWLCHSGPGKKISARDADFPVSKEAGCSGSLIALFLYVVVAIVAFIASKSRPKGSTNNRPSAVQPREQNTKAGTAVRRVQRVRACWGLEHYHCCRDGLSRSRWWLRSERRSNGAADKPATAVTNKAGRRRKSQPSKKMRQTSGASESTVSDRAPYGRCDVAAEGWPEMTFANELEPLAGPQPLGKPPNVEQFFV